MLEKEKVVFLHTPKTGGGAMQSYFHAQFRHVRRNYFLSFAGVDDSAFISDEHSTPGEGGNRCVIESIFANPSLVERLEASPHFQQAKVLFGHTTSALGELFPSYEFRYLTVLREPIDRTISNIAQFSSVSDGGVNFGSYRIRSEKYSDEYWDFIYDILKRGYPVLGLLTHENLYLRDCMTRILQGSRYLNVSEKPNLYRALANASNIRISFFDDFNNGIQRSFDAMGIPVDMSRNLKARLGKPEDGKDKKRYGPRYNAPQKLIDLVAANNQTDIRLYDILRNRGGES